MRAHPDDEAVRARHTQLGAIHDLTPASTKSNGLHGIVRTDDSIFAHHLSHHANVNCCLPEKENDEVGQNVDIARCLKTEGQLDRSSVAEN